ncbi:(p)ppGpp synthetase [candidate division KSB1 bacterium]|nr:MAG: (p)ppGpp synthetase [candidate division KSB1 bacterium]
MPDTNIPEVFNLEQYINAHLALYHDSHSQLTSIMDDLVNQISSYKNLKDHVHTIKSRIKSESSIADSLRRKYNKTKVPIPSDELFRGINDIIGMRILHLQRAQIEQINKGLLEWIDAYNYEKLEGPIAKVYDNETKAFFEKLGIDTESNARMYTSVHYVVLNNTKSRYSFEIQVRTLLEEAWGEVDHKINYPNPTTSVACLGQIRSLAHLTTGCNRLIDSILRSHEEYAVLTESLQKRNTENSTQHTR